MDKPWGMDPATIHTNVFTALTLHLITKGYGRVFASRHLLHSHFLSVISYVSFPFACEPRVMVLEGEVLGATLGSLGAARGAVVVARGFWVRLRML